MTAPLPTDISDTSFTRPSAAFRHGWWSAWARRLLRYALSKVSGALRPNLRATQEPPLPHPHQQQRDTDLCAKCGQPLFAGIHRIDHPSLPPWRVSCRAHIETTTPPRPSRRWRWELYAAGVGMIVMGYFIIKVLT